MKTFGIPETQTLVSLLLDEQGEPIFDSLAPVPRPDDWTPPPVVPLVKLDAPTYDASTHRVEPTLVWHADRVERDWSVVALSSEELIVAARKTWVNAAGFLGEFSMPELAAISLSVDATVAALRLLLLSWPADVWSDDPRIVMGLAALVSAGIIDETRKSQIISKS